MESCIIIGDIHLLLNEQRLQVFLDFWKHLKTIHKPGEPVIFLGDIFDKSLMSGEVIDFFIEQIHDLDDCEIFILQGNHDYSKQYKSIIKPLQRFSNITIIDELKVMDIVGNNCLFLPYRYTAKEDYANITGEYDYIFAHITDPEDQFIDEGISIVAPGKKIYGHTHLQNERCLGVPYCTRRGEENNAFRLARIFSDKSVEYIPLPKFFDYIDIDYDIDIEELDISVPNYQLIIHDAPNRKLAKEKFRGHHIYTIHIITEELEFSDNDKDSFENNKRKTLHDYYVDWATENKVGKEVHSILDKLLKK